MRSRIANEPGDRPPTVTGDRREHDTMRDLTPTRDSLDDIEVAPREQLESLQLERLQWSLRHAYDNVAATRAAFDAAGVHPDDCTSLADLADFPFTTKQDLRDAYPFGRLAVPREEIVRIHASSGTTGKATVVGYTADDVSMWADVCARSLRAAGVRPGWVVHVAYGYGLFTGGLGVHYGAERLGCTVVPASGGQTERQVSLLTDFGAQAICVTPSYMLALLDEFRRQGIDPRSTSLEVGVFGAEPWTDAMRAEIEDAFDIHAVDIYGLSEVIGPGVANECVEDKGALAVWEDHFYPEVVDPATGAVLPDGEQGELVFTSLTKQALPVIRYRTGDLTRLTAGTVRTMRRMDKVTGRVDDMLIVRGVNLFPSEVEELLVAEAALAPHYVLVLTRPDRLDEVTVRVEARLDAGTEARADAARSVQHRIKTNLGVTMDVEVVDPGGVERSTGKARRVLDER
jgi:phenylacetate-CoA ligase